MRSLGFPPFLDTAIRYVLWSIFATWLHRSISLPKLQAEHGHHNQNISWVTIPVVAACRITTNNHSDHHRNHHQPSFAIIEHHHNHRNHHETSLTMIQLHWPKFTMIKHHPPLSSQCSMVFTWWDAPFPLQRGATQLWKPQWGRNQGAVPDVQLGSLG